MMLTHLRLLYTCTILYVYVIPVRSDQCGNKFRVGQSDLGLRLEGQLIAEFDNDIRLHECASKCIALTHCLSINFAHALRLCQLNSATKSAAASGDAIIVANDSFIHVDIADWPKRSSDACSKKPCSGTEKCISLGSSYVCSSSDCADPPSTLNGGTLVPGHLSIGSVRTYECPIGMMMRGTNGIKCNGDAWSPAQFTCQYVRNCDDVKTCSSEYSNGEYWLYPTAYGNSSVKIYCHFYEHNPDRAPKAFVTVENSLVNFAFGGSANESKTKKYYYMKFRVDLETMVVIKNDTTHISYKGSEPWSLWYGKGIDCECDQDCSTPYGSFGIDTSNTGLIVDPTVQWAAFGNSSLMRNFTRSPDGTVITGSCGGVCGYCDTVGDMRLIIDPSYMIVPPEATFPSCV